MNHFIVTDICTILADTDQCVSIMGSLSLADARAECQAVGVRRLSLVPGRHRLLPALWRGVTTSARCSGAVSHAGQLPLWSIPRRGEGSGKGL